MADVRLQARKHDSELRSFRRRLFAAESDSTAWVGSGYVSQMAQLLRFGPVKSVTDRHAELTVVADTVDQAVMLEDPDQHGLILTLSVAAHHRMIHSRLPVDLGEAAAWMVEILGADWAGHAYSAGALSTTGGSGRLTTQFFYIFIGPDGKPHQVPAAFSVPVRPLRDVA